MGTLRVRAMILLSVSGCASLTLHAPPPDPRAAVAAVRFEAPLHEGRVDVVAAGVDGALRVCAPPCDLPVRVGRTEVAVRGAARFVQAIDVPAAGARYELADPSRGRRQAALIGIIAGGAVAFVGVLGFIIESGRRVSEEIGCGIGRGSTGPCDADDASRARVVGYSVTAAVGVVGIIASSLAGFTGRRIHLRRLPDVDVGAAPLPGGATVSAGVSF